MKIFRLKAVLYFHNQLSNKYYLQAVQATYDLIPSTILNDESADRQSKLVFIGRNLNQKDIEQSLYSITINPANQNK